MIKQIIFDWSGTLHDGSGLLDGAEGLLELLHQRNYSTFILSALPSTLLSKAVKQYQLGISAAYGSAQNKLVELPLLLEEQGLEADETLFIGDSDHDIIAGLSAGVITAAACYGYTSRHQLQQLAPDYLFDSIQELARFLDRDYLLNHRQIVVPTVGGLVQSRSSGKLLLINTRKWSHTWGVPGGKIEYGERMIDAYYRELRQETGLSIDNALWVLNQDSIEQEQFIYPRHFILINFYSQVEGQPKPEKNYESQEIGWFSLNEVETMALNQPTLALLEAVKDKGWLL